MRRVIADSSRSLNSKFDQTTRGTSYASMNFDDEQLHLHGNCPSCSAVREQEQLFLHLIVF